jgi:ABC-type sugar transport system substrate-binding protein
MKWGKIALIIAVLAFCVGLAPLLAQTESLTAGTPLPVPRVVKGRPLQIAFLIPQPSAEALQRGLRQAQIEAEHRVWKVAAEERADEIAKQRNAMQAFIQKNVDAIVFLFPFVEPLKDLILEARNKGIGVYNLDADLQPGVVINVTQPNGVVGAMLAYYIIDRLNGTGGVAVINYTGHILRQRCYAAKGLFESKADWPNLDLVGWQDLPNPGWEKASYDAAAAWLQKYGKKLNAIFAGWDTPGIMASRAIEAAGFTKDDCFVVGIDGGSEAYDMIRKGSPFVATMSQPFELYAHTVFEVINEVQIKGIAPGAKGSSVPKNRTIYATPVLSTADNLPAVGSVIHEVFRNSYYDPTKKDEWYFWGKPYTVSSKLK